MKKTQEAIGLRPEEFRGLRKLLLAGDLHTDSFATTLPLALLENESMSLREIDLALERRDEGTYGASIEKRPRR